MKSETEDRSATGESEAKFVNIFRRYRRPIQAYCTRRTPGSQVDDAVAETFLVAWRRLDDVPEGAATLPGSMALPTAFSLVSGGTRHEAAGSSSEFEALPATRLRRLRCSWCGTPSIARCSLHVPDCIRSIRRCSGSRYGRCPTPTLRSCSE